MNDYIWYGSRAKMNWDEHVYYMFASYYLTWKPEGEGWIHDHKMDGGLSRYSRTPRHTHTPTCTYMYIYIIKYMSRMCRYTNIRMYESSLGLERWTSKAFLNLEDGPNSKLGRILGFTKAICAVTSCYQVWDAHVDESKSYRINEHIGQLWSVIVIAP